MSDAACQAAGLDAGLVAEAALAEVQTVPADALPEPYRGLLVHSLDMTSTLEAHHGQPMTLRVLHRRITDTAVDRRVLLVGTRDGAVAEYGAIRIHLTGLPADAVDLVRACQTPLGAVLTGRGIPFVSAPRAYLRLRMAHGAAKDLDATPDDWHFGRHNRLSHADGRAIADIIEVLPRIERPAGAG